MLVVQVTQDARDGKADALALAGGPPGARIALIAAADAALYDAKDSGNNHVVRANDAVSHAPQGIQEERRS